MRILIVADASSVHIYNYAKNVLFPEGYDITILNTASDREIGTTFADFYHSCNIKVLNLQGVKSAFSFIRNTCKTIEKAGFFDVVHCHSVVYIVSIALFLKKEHFGKVVMSYWGSDLYRIGLFQQILNYPLLIKADKITFITEEMKSFFLNKAKINCYLNHKLHICDIADLFYDDIDAIAGQNIKSELKQRFKLDPNKILVTIGYTGRTQMQQIKAIKAIIEGSKMPLDSIQFAFPGYEMSDETYREIDNYMKDKGVKYKIFRGFMETKDIPYFRTATDIFIHPQTTDALSNSFLEHLYAGNIVINATWLSYPSLEKLKVWYEKFNNFEDLSYVFDRCLKNFEQFLLLAQKNKTIIDCNFSWKYWKIKWLSLYK